MNDLCYRIQCSVLHRLNTSNILFVMIMHQEPLQVSNHSGYLPVALVQADRPSNLCPLAVLFTHSHYLVTYCRAAEY